MILGVGYTVAERMGILPDGRKAGNAVKEVRIVNSTGRRVGGFATDVLRRILAGRFTSVPRGELAATIYRTIEGRVETIFGNSISAIEERSADVLVSFEQGGRREFDLVIGADGLHSIVRTLAFGPERRFEKHLGYIVAVFQVDGYRPRDELTYVLYTQPGRQVARFALAGDRTMFFFIFVSDRLTAGEPRDAAGRKAVLHQVFGDAGWECRQILRTLDQVKDVYFDRVSQIQMDHWSKGRVALLGDAAACVSLLAGEGTGLALTAAYTLGGELSRAGTDYIEAFYNYEGRLRDLIESKQKSARGFAATLAPKTRAGTWIRSQVFRLMAVPPIASFIVRRDLQDHFDLPDYDIWGQMRVGIATGSVVAGQEFG